MIQMKLIAVLQVLILLTSVVIPEGSHVVMRGCECGDNCQCSEESRQAGKCCCGTKGSGNTSRERSCCQSSDKHQSPAPMECCGNPQSKDVEKSECCQQRKQAVDGSCCGTSNSGCGTQSDGGSDLELGCGCKQIAVQIMVILMPRLRPTTTTFHGDPDVVGMLLPFSERMLMNARLPEVPPPKKSFSV